MWIIFLIRFFSFDEIYIPDEDVRFILWAPNFETVVFALRPLVDKGLALVVGGGAAIAAHGSSSSTAGAVVVVADLTFTGLRFNVGAGAAMEPHKSSSSSLLVFGVCLGRIFVTVVRTERNLP